MEIWEHGIGFSTSGMIMNTMLIFEQFHLFPSLCFSPRKNLAEWKVTALPKCWFVLLGFVDLCRSPPLIRTTGSAAVATKMVYSYFSRLDGDLPGHRPGNMPRDVLGDQSWITQIVNRCQTFRNTKSYTAVTIITAGTKLSIPYTATHIRGSAATYLPWPWQGFRLPPPLRLSLEGEKTKGEWRKETITNGSAYLFSRVAIKPKHNCVQRYITLFAFPSSR